MPDALTPLGKAEYIGEAFDLLGIPEGSWRGFLESALAKNLSSREITLLRQLAAEVPGNRAPKPPEKKRRRRTPELQKAAAKKGRFGLR